MRITNLVAGLFATAITLGFAANASAMPGAGGDKAMDAAIQTFQRCDKNQDDSLDKKEFGSCFSGMKEEAFDAIDTDRDGKISRPEWQAFSISHSMGREGQGSGMPPAASTAPETPRQGLPLVTPPNESKDKQ